MADRYLVLIVDPDEFDWEGYTKKGKNEYDMYSLYANGKELPHGVWLQEWLVPDGEKWDSHPASGLCDSLNIQYHLIEWSEIEQLEGVKDTRWWIEQARTLETLYNAMHSTLILANTVIDDVVELVDPEHEGLYEAQQGEIVWTDADTVGFYLDKVQELLKKRGVDEDEYRKDNAST